MTKPESKFCQYDTDAAAEVERIESEGGLAWITKDYGLDMSGRREYMGQRVNWFTPEQVREAAAKSQFAEGKP